MAWQRHKADLFAAFQDANPVVTYPRPLTSHAASRCIRAVTRQSQVRLLRRLPDGPRSVFPSCRRRCFVTSQPHGPGRKPWPHCLPDELLVDDVPLAVIDGGTGRAWHHLTSTSLPTIGEPNLLERLNLDCQYR